MLALNEYWEATAALDLDRVDEFYHNDVIIKYPQSGEQIRGKRSLRELRALTPTKVAGLNKLTVKLRGVASDDPRLSH